MSKISNVILMLKYLSYGRKYSAKELANKLEVSPRMIRCYKEDLEKAGIFIDTIRGPYGGYTIKNTSKIPNILFTKDDISTLDKIINNLNDKNLITNTKQLQNKIKILHQEYSNMKLDFNKETLLKYNLISKAIKENKDIKIYYFSKNKTKTRNVTPYQLFTYDNKWYVIVKYSIITNDIRYLSLDRLNNIELI